MEVKELGAEPTKKNTRPEDANSIWIGNIGYETTLDEMHDLFFKHGGINTITFKTDHDGNRLGLASNKSIKFAHTN